MQAGGHRFDPGQLHQKLIYCFLIGAIGYDADQETGWLRPAGFNRPRAGLLRGGWMFDNEIDWVTCSGERFRRREANGKADFSEHVKNTRPSTCR